MSTRTVSAVADFNGDSRSDIFLLNDLGFSLWIMNCATTSSDTLVGSPTGYTLVAASDFTGDGKADILLRDTLGNLGMWIMDGATVTSGAFVGTAGGYEVAGVGNYDGDSSGGLVGPLPLSFEIR